MVLKTLKDVVKQDSGKEFCGSYKKEDQSKLETRPPVIVVMGHVDREAKLLELLKN